MDNYEVRWRLDSWNDVLRLRLPAEVTRAEFEEGIDREAAVLAAWDQREPASLGEVPWSWVLPDLRVGQLFLQDWFPLVGDLRLFFWVDEPATAEPGTIHILAVSANGGKYLEERFEQLWNRLADARAQADTQ